MNKIKERPFLIAFYLDKLSAKHNLASNVLNFQNRMTLVQDPTGF